MLRGVRGITQRGMAVTMDVTTNYIHMIEAGRCLPSVGFLERLCEWGRFNPKLATIYLYRDHVERYESRMARKLKI